MAYSKAGKEGIKSLTGVFAAFKTGWKGKGSVAKSQIQPERRWRLRLNTERAASKRQEGEDDEGEEADEGVSNSGGHSSSKHRRVTLESSLP